MIRASHQMSEISEEDYRQVATAIEAAEVFSRMITPCVYVADLARGNFLYVSDCLLKHFRCTREEVMPLGHSFFTRFLSEKELAMLPKLDHAIKTLFGHAHQSELIDETLSVDINMTLGGKRILVNYKIKLFATDCDGRPWLVLGLVSRSAVREGGQIIVGNAKSHERRRFVDDEGPGHWEMMPYDRLSDLEMEMLSLSSRGYSLDEIAKMLHRSVPAVKHYRKQVFDRLGVKNVAHALALADDLCLI